jgi:hypothetical protein
MNHPVDNCGLKKREILAANRARAVVRIHGPKIEFCSTAWAVRAEKNLWRRHNRYRIRVVISCGETFASLNIQIYLPLV